MNEERERVLRERARELCRDFVFDGSPVTDRRYHRYHHSDCYNCDYILAALRQTEEEARKDEQEQHHALGAWADCPRCISYYAMDQEAAYMCATVEDQVRTARAEGERAGREEMQATFDLRWRADQRAIKMWQHSHPRRENAWPDHADLCVWLLEQLDGAERAGREAEREEIVKLLLSPERRQEYVFSGPMIIPKLAALVRARGSE